MNNRKNTLPPRNYPNNYRTGIEEAVEKSRID